MKNGDARKYFNARIEAGRGQKIDGWAQEGRRSFTQELLLLIDQGIAWRKEHGNKIPDQK